MARPTIRLYDGYTNTSPQLKGAVIELQTLLKQKGYRMLIDGEFHVYTENTLKLFQSSRGLKATGVCDTDTWAALLQQAPANLPIAFPTTYAMNTPALVAELQQAMPYRNIILYYANQVKIPSAVILGIGSRESRWGLALTPRGPAGTGDHGNGHGLLQVDIRYHPAHIASGDWKDPVKHLAYGITYLRNCMDTFTKRTGMTGLTALQGAVAGYNCGAGNSSRAWSAGLDIDYYTTGRDYSRNVFSRAGWFQLNGWNY